MKALSRIVLAFSLVASCGCHFSGAAGIWVPARQTLERTGKSIHDALDVDLAPAGFKPLPQDQVDRRKKALPALAAIWQADSVRLPSEAALVIGPVEIELQLDKPANRITVTVKSHGPFKNNLGHYVSDLVRDTLHPIDFGNATVEILSE
ncbi:MAG: hypothetical protein EXS39_01655 [Opitutaceae bacterium]|nr:hypothetical protein [Opitutaceae bacterium]